MEAFLLQSKKIKEGGELKVLVNCKHFPSFLGGRRRHLSARKLLTPLKRRVSQLSWVRCWEMFTVTLITFTPTNKQTSQPWSLYGLPEKEITGKSILQIFWKLKFSRFQSLSTQFFLFVFKESTHRKQFSEVTSAHLFITTLKSSERACWASNPFRNYQQQTLPK